MPEDDYDCFRCKEIVMSEMREWFFLRPGFDNFKLEPRAHRRILIGDLDRKRRDQLLTMLDGAARAMHGAEALRHLLARMRPA